MDFSQTISPLSMMKSDNESKMVPFFSGIRVILPALTGCRAILWYILYLMGGNLIYLFSLGSNGFTFFLRSDSFLAWNFSLSVNKTHWCILTIITLL